MMFATRTLTLDPRCPQVRKRAADMVTLHVQDQIDQLRELCPMLKYLSGEAFILTITLTATLTVTFTLSPALRSVYLQIERKPNPIQTHWLRAGRS